MTDVEPSEFISGNGFASRCRYVLNYERLSIDESADGGWWFCKSEWLEYFFRRVAPDSPFVLFSSNSDRAIDGRFERALRNPNLVAWFAVNVALSHPKLFAIPIGIRDPSWRQASPAVDLQAVQARQIAKTRLFEVNFDVKTNPGERLLCLAETGVELDPPAPPRDYLARLAASYFCIAPSGRGLDTHRVWEALYLRAIPVVTASILTEQHADLPLIVLDDWSSFRSVEFSPELYHATWRDWDPGRLSLDRYVERIRDVLARSSGPPEQARDS